jgi:hypothetical protein
MRVVSGNLGYNQRTDNADRTDRTHNCRDSGDSIEALGGPKLSASEFALGGLMLFFAATYSLNQRLERRPFRWRHIACCLLVVGGGCVDFLVVPLVFFVWHWISPGHCCQKGCPQTQAHGDR